MLADKKKLAAEMEMNKVHASPELELDDELVEVEDIDIDIERIGGDDKGESDRVLTKRVSTLMVFDELGDLDCELQALISGQIESEENAEQHTFERQNTMWAQQEKADLTAGTAQSEKAKPIYHIIFLIIFLVGYAIGMYVITTIEDYNRHWLAYMSIFYFLATLFIALDLFDQLLRFISFWENCWNVPKLGIRIKVKWPHGDRWHDRRDRRKARRQIMSKTKEFMSWDKCCSTLWWGVRSKIEDQSLLINALIRDEGEHQIALAKKDDLTKALQSREYKNCTVESSTVLENIKYERRAPHLFLFLFFLFAVVDYILLKVTDEEDGYEVPKEVGWLADIVFFYLTILLMIIALLSNWTKFSFACSEKAYIQGFINISIVGFFILGISRILRPPKTEKNKVQDISTITWHRYHDWNKQVGGVVLTLVLLWVLCVLFFVISVAAFAEFAKMAADWGVGPALSCFVAFSMVIMLAPPAPGNIIDVFGGFLIVMVLIRNNSEFWSFFSATAVAIIMVVALHYTGACLQWMMGKLPFAQQWMNRAFPIEMLATSDAVLGDANWFKVGLVGFVFMDTANGLNQGRMEMEFWTQLFSEWGAFPNGLCLVSFGATLALNGLSCDEDRTSGCLNGNFAWTSQAIPLLFIMTGMTQFLGTSLGVGALAGSLDTDKYIMSREKWYIVHRMMGVGYIPTKKGWNEDIYELAKTDNPARKPYFEKACNLQHKWLKYRKNCKSAADVTEAVEKFKHEGWIPLRYKDHMKYLLKKTIELERKESELFSQLFRKKEKTDLIKVGMWDDVETNKSKKIMQGSVVIVLTISFYLGMFGFYMNLDLEDAVKLGLDFLWDIDDLYWYSAGVFVLFSCIYYLDSVMKSFFGLFRGIIYFITCCPVDPEIETGYLTPSWSAPAK